MFLQGAFHVTDELDFTLGARYTEDEKDYTYHRHNPDGTVPSPPHGLPVRADPAAELRCWRGLDGAHGSLRIRTSEQFDWRVALDYQFTDDVMAYVQVSTGYKGGGINPRPFYREPGACRSIPRR